MNLYAAGFNAWNQLSFQPSKDQQQQPGDLYEFTHVLSEERISGVESHLTYTVVQIGGGSKTAGAVPQHHANFRKRFGQFALAANDSVILPFEDKHIRQYDSIYSALSGTEPIGTHTFAGDIVQYVAYSAGFAVLTAAGEVWTWGDDRYPGCLGREVSAASPASLPGRVTDLDELPTGKIVKIAAGGYTLAAVTSGHDLYCWGGHPGRKEFIDGVSPSSGPVPVVVEDENDVVQVAIGESHAIALTEKGDVFVIGENTNNQLGMVISAAQSSGSWAKIKLPLEEEVPVGVAAGPRASFIKTRIK